MILVTGGTGLVGSHLLYQLTLQESEILAIYRTQEKIAQVQKVFSYYSTNFQNQFDKITWIHADITDITSLENVFSNTISHVYHCAALVSFNPKDYHAMRKVNIEGTANIVNFSIQANVKKFCYVSSIAAIGDAINGKAITEENEWIDTGDKHGYAISKYGAELEVWRGSQEGLDVIIVNPGIILGSGFFKEGSGKLFSQVKNGLKFYTEGVTGFVGVKDVVKSMLELMNSSVKNERFILVAENISFKDVFFSIASSFNVKKPSVKIGTIATEIFWRIDWLLTKLTGKEPLLTKNSAKSCHKQETYNTNKIKNAINFQFKNIDAVIEDVCEDFLK